MRASAVKHITLKLSTKIVSIHILESKTTKAFIWEIVAFWFTFSSKDNKKEQCLFSNICESGQGRLYNLGIKVCFPCPFTTSPKSVNCSFQNKLLTSELGNPPTKLHAFFSPIVYSAQEPLKWGYQNNSPITSGL